MFEDKIDALNQARELGSTKKKKKPKAAVKEPEKKVRTHAEKRTYTVDEIQDILNISRTSAYNLTKTGQFRVVKRNMLLYITTQMKTALRDRNGKPIPLLPKQRNEKMKLSINRIREHL